MVELYSAKNKKILALTLTIFIVRDIYKIKLNYVGCVFHSNFTYFTQAVLCNVSCRSQKSVINYGPIKFELSKYTIKIYSHNLTRI